MHKNQKKDSKGRFQNVYSDDEFLKVLRESDFPLDSSTVAKKVGCSQRRAQIRLKNLGKEGKIESKKVGNTLIWKINGGVSKPTLLDYVSVSLSERFQEDLERSRGIIMALKKTHSRDILNGYKRIEFRRSRIKKTNYPDIGFIYETAPTKSIVGAFSIDKIERMKIADLCEIGAKETPSTRESLKEYFEGNSHGTAIFIDEVHPIIPPIPMKKEDSGERVFTPPQSFHYVNPSEFIESVIQRNSDSPPSESQQSGLPSKTS